MNCNEIKNVKCQCCFLVVIKLNTLNFFVYVLCFSFLDFKLQTKKENYNLRRSQSDSLELQLQLKIKVKNK